MLQLARVSSRRGEALPKLLILTRLITAQAKACATKFEERNMSSMDVRSIPKGPIGKLRALARAILSATAEEEVRLQRQDLRNMNSGTIDGRVADPASRVAND
jgi:hypothetical protein